MSILQRLMGRPAPVLQPASSLPAAGAPTSTPSPASLRRDLLRLALRQTLRSNGIPAQWIGAEVLDVAGRNGPGIHVRLLLQHWDARLVACTMALQEDYERRLLEIEPDAHSWLRGFSWQYQLPVGTPFDSLPDPSTWTEPRSAVEAPAVLAPQESERRRQELDKAFADHDRQRGAVAATNFEKTQPYQRPN